MNFKIGQKADLVKTFTKEEVEYFSKISEDSNRIHFDEIYAASTIFQKPIVQGPLVASLIGGVLGTTLPGNGTIYVNQNTNFKAPVFINETITVCVEIIDIKLEKSIITLRTTVEKENGTLAIEGTAVIKYFKPTE
jgi:enoyl-CoA hydratase